MHFTQEVVFILKSAFLCKITYYLFLSTFSLLHCITIVVKLFFLSYKGAYTDASRLSMKAAFDKVWRLEQNWGKINGGDFQTLRNSLCCEVCWFFSLLNWLSESSVTKGPYQLSTTQAGPGLAAVENQLQDPTLTIQTFFLLKLFNLYILFLTVEISCCHRSDYSESVSTQNHA